MTVQLRAALGSALLIAAASAAAAPVELLTNGNFETGSFAGWTHVAKSGSNGNLFIDTPGTTTPQSGHATAANAAGGRSYALTDQSGGGTYSLSQGFTVAPGASSVVFKFQMFANNWNTSTIVNPAGLTHTAGANQHVRVDLLTAAAGAFDIGAAVLQNFYLGADANVGSNPWVDYSFDITSLVSAGGSYQVRFAEVDNQFFFNMGVDNVSIEASTVPEPGSVALVGLALLGLVGAGRRAAKR